MLATLSEVKDFLGETGNSYDSFLEFQIELISETISQYCRRVFEATDWIQTLEHRDFEKYNRNQIMLFHYPAIAVTGFDDVYEGSPSEVRSPITGYRLHKPTATIEGGGGYNYGFAWSGWGSSNKIEIKYRAGYETIPAPIRHVIYSLIQEKYNRKKSGVDLNFGSDVQRINIPGVIGVDYDYSLQTNETENAFGQILGNYINVLSTYRSERAVIGSVRREYVEEDI